MTLHLRHNFIDNELCNLFAAYIEKNIDKFNTGPHKLYFTLTYGKDHYHLESLHELTGIDEIKPKVLIIFDQILDFIYKNYKKTNCSNELSATFCIDESKS